MEHFTGIKILHMVATVLFFLSALGLVVWVVRGRLAGDTTIQTRTLQRPWLFAWIVMGLCLLAMPISGWWLVHIAGWPLSQTWLLVASVLFVLGALSWLWLLLRLNRLRVLMTMSHPRFTLALAVFSGVCFIAIAGLMGAKPV
jgi:uncharacterized membrane protein